MPMHVALLRGINVVGRSMIAMSDLRDMCGGLGFADVKSLLQSGNLVFRTDRRLSGASLERMLEAETAKQLGASPTYMVRSAAEWKAVIAANPFPNEAKRDPGHLLVMFLKSETTAKNVKQLEAAIRGRETARGRQTPLRRLSRRCRPLEIHARLDRATPRHPRDGAELEYGPQDRRAALKLVNRAHVTREF